MGNGALPHWTQEIEMTTKQELFQKLSGLMIAAGEKVPSQKWYNRTGVGTLRYLVELYEREQK